MLDFLAVFANDKGYTEMKSQIMEEAKKGKVVSMCTVLQSYKEKGIEEGQMKIIMNMYENKFTMEQIALATKKSVEEIKELIEKNTLVMV